MRSAPERYAERGTQILELAAVLPVLLLLALMASEGAALVRAHQIFTNAARESARLAVMEENEPLLPPNSTALQDAATCYAARNGIIATNPLPASCSNISGIANCVAGQYSVTITELLIANGATQVPATKVHVSCGYQLKFLPALPWFHISNIIPLATTVEWRNLY